MASKLKIDNGKVKDGSKQVGMIKNSCIYDRNIILAHSIFWQ